jgi:hypothetical protein
VIVKILRVFMAVTFISASEALRSINAGCCRAFLFGCYFVRDSNLKAARNEVSTGFLPRSNRR